MRIEIENIKVAARIRKLTANIDALAADIQKNGLINPITVMAVDGGYQLLAGLRRLRATQSLGWTEIEATVAAPKDAESALFIEHSENEQREAFTFSEKMDYARLIAEIEKAKAKERMLAGKRQDDPMIARAQGTKGTSREAIGPKVGMSGAQYDRAKYIADRAPQTVIDELDRGERTVFGTYEELRTTEKKASAETDSAATAPETRSTEQPVISRCETSEPARLEPVPETDLDRAIRAESELDAYKYRRHNELYHRDSIIESLRNRVSELETELEAAHKRIRELEGELPCKIDSLT